MRPAESCEVIVMIVVNTAKPRRSVKTIRKSQAISVHSLEYTVIYTLSSKEKKIRIHGVSDRESEVRPRPERRG